MPEKISSLLSAMGKITLAKLVDLMIRYSDNTASLWCQELAGTGTVINDWLQSHGYEKTRVNSRTPGREKIGRIGVGVRPPPKK